MIPQLHQAFIKSIAEPLTTDIVQRAVEDQNCSYEKDAVQVRGQPADSSALARDLMKMNDDFCDEKPESLKSGSISDVEMAVRLTLIAGNRNVAKSLETTQYRQMLALTQLQQP